MSRPITVTFGLHDRFNPGCGYQLRIDDALSGENILFTSKHPVSGADLLTASACMGVINAYISPTEKPWEDD